MRVEAYKYQHCHQFCLACSSINMMVWHPGMDRPSRKYNGKRFLAAVDIWLTVMLET